MGRNPQVINKRTYICKGNAEPNTDQDEPIITQPEDIRLPLKSGSPNKDRNPQFTKDCQDSHDVNLPNTTQTNPEVQNPQSEGRNWKGTVVEEINALKEHGVEIASQHGGPNSQTKRPAQQPKHRDPTGHEPIINY